jgi:hypothetical protein
LSNPMFFFDTYPTPCMHLHIQKHRRNVPDMILHKRSCIKPREGGEEGRHFKLCLRKSLLHKHPLLQMLRGILEHLSNLECTSMTLNPVRNYQTMNPLPENEEQAR